MKSQLINYWKVQDNSTQYSLRAIKLSIDSSSDMIVIEPSYLQLTHINSPDSQPYILSELLFSVEGYRLFNYKDIESIEGLPGSLVKQILEAIKAHFSKPTGTEPDLGYFIQELHLTPSQIHTLTTTQLNQLFNYVKEQNKKHKQALGKKR
jgi:hypothetical protein